MMNISYRLTRTRTCANQVGGGGGGRNVRFSENLARFVFLKHPFRDSPFCLITNDITNKKNRLYKHKSELPLLRTAQGQPSQITVPFQILLSPKNKILLNAAKFEFENL